MSSRNQVWYGVILRSYAEQMTPHDTVNLDTQSPFAHKKAREINVRCLDDYLTGSKSYLGRLADPCTIPSGNGFFNKSAEAVWKLCFIV